jgi:hypothetical protein
MPLSKPSREVSNYQPDDLGIEIVKAVETGINRTLDSSLKYSPLKLFVKLFKAGNPATMNYVRERARHDILEELHSLQNFNESLFIKVDEYFTPAGRILLNASYSTGIRIIRENATISGGFKMVTNADVRNAVYDDILISIKTAGWRILGHAMPPQENPNIPPPEAIANPEGDLG